MNVLALPAIRRFKRSTFLFAWIALGAGPLLAQTCNFFVGPNGSNSNAGISQSAAFKTLQYAHDYIANPDKAGVTHLRTQPLTVCALTGTYTAPDYKSASNIRNVSAQDVLDISVAGTASAPITFTAAPGNHPVIIQTGWSGVKFLATAQYVTLSGFSISGMAYNANWDVALSRYATTSKPAPYAYYDGNCVTIAGNAVDTPARIPHHLTIANNIIYACGGGGIAAMQSDYLTIDHNNVHDCAWTSIYGTSGISTLDDVNSDGDTRTTAPYKIVITNNYVYGNLEKVPWVSASGGPEITDGEGIIIDTNNNVIPIRNSAGVKVTLPAYQGRTLVANNVLWNNGSAAIEAFQSLHMDIENNSTYRDVTTPVLAGRGELFLNSISDVNAANNVLYGAVPVSGSVLSRMKGSFASFQHNVYFAGSGVAIKHPEATSGFREGAEEMFGDDPQYFNPVPSQESAAADLRVGASSKAATSGCACFAPAADILGKSRPGVSGQYASGAYADPH